MTDGWDEKLKAVLRKTGDDLKKVGDEIKAEAEKLLADVKDPQKHQKVKAGLKQFGDWARQTAEEVAVAVEDGVKKAEQAIGKASDRIAGVTPAEREAREVAPTPPSPPPTHMEEPAPRPAKPAAKTVGARSAPSRRGGKRPTQAGKKPAKTLGKKRS